MIQSTILAEDCDGFLNQKAISEIKSERDQLRTSLKAQHSKDLAALREKLEKEHQAALGKQKKELEARVAALEAQAAAAAK